MKLFITGGTGFVGGSLITRLIQDGHEITILTRSLKRVPPLPGGASYLEGDPGTEGPWQKRVGEHDGIINLAGASIFRRWTDSEKKLIRESRILTTKNIVKALEARRVDETHLLSASAIGYYGFQEDQELDERGPAGSGFLADLTREWESASLAAEGLGVRVVLTRFGVVLGKGGGALQKIIPLFKWWLGSPLGNGKQWFSWVHLQDLANIFPFLLEHREISGPVNCTAPGPVRNVDMTKTLGEVLNKPTFMPAVPGFILGTVLGEFGSMLLKGQRVLPKKLTDSGFHFSFPEIRGALEDLVGPSR
ncbi:MAG: TIGR01777 family oxidoreductase [Deltaproteobacteria bacterium]|nr:TIGR01777 family oxidoreductase [Deltaproteobacteria bacterium]